MIVLLFNNERGIKARSGPRKSDQATRTANETGTMTKRTMTDAEFQGRSTPPY